MLDGTLNYVKFISWAFEKSNSLLRFDLSFPLVVSSLSLLNTHSFNGKMKDMAAHPVRSTIPINQKESGQLKYIQSYMSNSS